MLLRALYRVDVRGMEHFHAAGKRVLIVANHVSLLDGVLLFAYLPEIPTFAINTRIASRPLFRPFLRCVDLFIMDPTNPLSVKSMVRFLRTDRKAVIFPEGRITITGVPMKVYEGPGMIADRADAPVLPISIGGAQYTPFAYLKDPDQMRWFPKITLIVHPPRRLLPDAAATGHDRRKAAGIALQRILFHLFYETFDARRTVFAAFLGSRGLLPGHRPFIEDVNRNLLTRDGFLLRVLGLARAIRRHVAAGESIGVLLPNTVATPAVFMALQYLGCVPAMLNYTVGGQVLLQACDAGGIRRIITARAFVEQAHLGPALDTLGSGVEVRFLEDLRAEIGWLDHLVALLSAPWAGVLYKFRVPHRNPDQPALILFTSGSEGVPKGVALSHANLLSNFAQVRCHIDFRPSDLLFSCLPLFHSFGLNAGFIMPMLAGCRIFLYPTPLHYRIIPELIYELGATILFSTNTFLKGYARHAHPYDMTTLRYVVAGAERLGEDTVRAWSEKFGVRVLQGYGVTEASPVIAVNTPLANRPGTVGQLLPGMECYLAPVPGINEGGRLVVRGPNAMLGYLLPGRNDIVPAAADRGPGWHDTGDIATVDADGYITILGRARRFAKIGGEMISLTAVEELAQRVWPGHSHAALSLADERKGEKIHLVTSHHGATRRELQDAARALQYGELYLPRRIVLIDAMPVLSTGKTDYVALQQLAQEEDSRNTGWIRRLGEILGHEYPGRIAAGSDCGAGQLH
ncbi:MAG: AMP-binding protein [Gammaproteobacteria bacterium]|nr:AMP-binding protein [Gammaproteobacteria bacterium]